ncbi:hypothetical protein [Nitrospirillum viridazoti]|uniref:hypothetical protein n=1 Tax=Nitrospirillum viridazoti TaxID=3144925 RepID=UPI001642DA37|nr:hypothetical protein [Nitrospirillum amazonense]
MPPLSVARAICEFANEIEHRIVAPIAQFFTEHFLLILAIRVQTATFYFDEEKIIENDDDGQGALFNTVSSVWAMHRVVAIAPHE